MRDFKKNEHFLPPDTHKYVCVSVGKKYSFFGIDSQIQVIPRSKLPLVKIRKNFHTMFHLFLATESALKLMKNTFCFISKGLFVLMIFNFLS